MKLTTKEIMEIIPHRHPFLLVDTIEEMEPGVRAVGRKCVTYTSLSLQDIFLRNLSCRESFRSKLWPR